MKNLLFFFPAFSVLMAGNANAQNLVPNPSFEIANRMPDKNNNSINRAKDWMAPIANSDYYMKGAGRHAGTPKNVFGRQKPHTGNAYAGICTRTTFMEYLQAKLSDTLTKGQEYLVEFYVSRAERSLGSLKDFGVLFAAKKIWGIDDSGISAKPQIVFTKPGGYRNKRKWMKLSAVYKAAGNEAVLIIGHFTDPDKKSRILSHYYIDDVSVTLIKKNEDTVAVAKAVDSLKVSEPVSKSFAPKLDEAITLKNIFFNTNKAELLSESFSELDTFVRYLIEMPGTSVKISGHTDNTGSESQNQALSAARAKAVADYLKSRGIDGSRISYMGYGSSQPVATNETDEGKQQNRRVEFIITKK